LAIDRRTLLTAGAPALLGAGAFAVYQQAPMFWQQYKTEMFADIAQAPKQPKVLDWPDHGLHITWLGHATTLIQIDGFRILTDPVFSDRCGIDLGLLTLGPKRLVEAALPLKNLPRIDLILLSHAHFDHWDMPTLRALASPETQIICARETSDLLTASRWKEIQELGWRESAQVGPIHVKAFEVKHWGARVRSDTHRGYNGYLIESGNHKVLFPGDTAMTDNFKELRGGRAIEAAIMPIGAYNPWIANHCTPEEALRMAEWAGAERVIPIHHQTFVLSREPLNEPIERLMTGVKGETGRVVAAGIGDEWSTLS